MTSPPARLVPGVLALAVAAGLLVGCGGADEPGPGATTGSGDDAFCRTYAEQRDGPPSEAAALADRLEGVGVPSDLGGEARAGFVTYLTYLRDEGDGRDEDLYDDQYAAVLDVPARGRFSAFLDAVDQRCGTAPKTLPTGASEQDYCTAYEAVFEGRRTDLLSRTGTPDGLGADGFAADDFALETRRGAAAVADRLTDLTPAGADALTSQDDDAMRRLVGVTDAFYADTWFLTSYQLCFGADVTAPPDQWCSGRLVAFRPPMTRYATFVRCGVLEVCRRVEA